MKIVFSTPNHSNINEVMETLSSLNAKIEFCANGKETQTTLAEEHADFLILDSKVENHSFLFVLKYCRVKSPSTEVILLFDSKKEMEGLDFTEEELKDLGINIPIFEKKYAKTVLKVILKETSFEKWKLVKEIDINEISDTETEVKAYDNQFTKISVDTFFTGNTTIFDVFLKLNKNKYLKILNRGEKLDTEKLKKYREKHNLEFLYFKTEERVTYINYINNLIGKLKNNTSRINLRKSNLLSGATDKYIEELYVHGLNKNLYDEGAHLCDNIYNTLTASPKTSELIKLISEHCMSHHFLTSIFSVAIAKHIEWAGRATVNNLAMGAMLHDIGLARFKWYNDNPSIKESELSTSQREDYLKHPEYGYEMLKDIPYVPEAVRQITLQHHEYINGKGFPNALSGQKIYPLAKIISLADYFSTKIIENQKTPMDILREFIPDPKETSKFEPQFIKALIRSFVEDE